MFGFSWFGERTKVRLRKIWPNISAKDLSTAIALGWEWHARKFEYVFILYFELNNKFRKSELPSRAAKEYAGRWSVWFIELINFDCGMVEKRFDECKTAAALALRRTSHYQLIIRQAHSVYCCFTAAVILRFTKMLRMQSEMSRSVSESKRARRTNGQTGDESSIKRLRASIVARFHCSLPFPNLKQTRDDTNIHHHKALARIRGPRRSGERGEGRKWEKQK